MNCLLNVEHYRYMYTILHNVTLTSTPKPIKVIASSNKTKAGIKYICKIVCFLLLIMTFRCSLSLKNPVELNKNTSKKEQRKTKRLKESAHTLGYEVFLSRPSIEVNTIWVHK